MAFDNVNPVTQQCALLTAFSVNRIQVFLFVISFAGICLTESLCKVHTCTQLWLPPPAMPSAPPQEKNEHKGVADG